MDNMSQGTLSSDECLLRVRAQIMKFDESAGLWVPPGGLSNISLRRLSVFPTGDVAASTTDKAKLEFVITGSSQNDDSIVLLSCVIKKILPITQATPTFRHWQLQKKKYGLTFQSPPDAKTFDLAMASVMAELKDASPEPSPNLKRCGVNLEHSDVSTESVSLDSDEPARPSSSRQPYGFLAKPVLGERRSASPQLSSISVPSPLRITRSSQSAQMQLPVHRLLSLPTNMTKSLSTPLQPTHAPAYRSPVRLRESSSHSPATSTTLSAVGSSKGFGFTSPNLAEKYTYVDVISNKSSDRSPVTTHSDPPSGGPHDYSYPCLRPDKRDSISSIKMHNLDMMSSHRPPLLPIKSKRKRNSSKKRNTDTVRSKYSERSRCKYCHEYYSVDTNESGACEFAPDRVKDCINRVSCVPAASRLMCRCVRDSECDGSSTHPCSCDKVTTKCFGRWLLMAALSLFMPCLCCYYPLKGCHKVGLACGWCGGKHEAMDSR